MGAEHPAVVVALVDDDEAQRAEEPRPARVARQQRAVQHVGVGQDVLAVVAGPLPHLRCGVAVVGGAPQVGQPAGPAAAGWRAGPGPAPWSERGRGPPAPRWPFGPRADSIACSAGEQVGQRLARRRAGGDHDVPTLVGEVGGGDLVRPRCGYADPLERLAHGGVQPRRPLALPGAGGARRPRGGSGCPRGRAPAGQAPHQRFEVHHLHPFSLSADSDGLPTAPAGRGSIPLRSMWKRRSGGPGQAPGSEERDRGSFAADP